MRAADAALSHQRHQRRRALRREGQRLAVQFRRETKPVLTVHEALAQWIDEKRAAWRHPDTVARNVANRIKVWIPDVPVDEIDAVRACETPHFLTGGDTGGTIHPGPAARFDPRIWCGSAPAGSDSQRCADLPPETGTLF